MMEKREKRTSIFDDKHKYVMVSEEELTKLHDYVFKGISGFDIVEAKKLFETILSRQGQCDINSWRIICKYCPLSLRCDKVVEDACTCELFKSLPVRKYASYALEEVAYQRQRLMKVFRDGECDKSCENCILCDNDKKCMFGEIKVIVPYFGKTEEPKQSIDWL